MRMQDMTIGIIGGGTVGKAIAKTYLGYVKEVRIFDIIYEKRTNSGDETLASDLIFICLPENELEQQCSYFGCRDYRHKNYVIKSTCPIGTTRKLAEKYNLTNIVHSPEFLTERTALIDALIPARNIIGDSRRSLDYILGGCWESLIDLYKERFPGIPILEMSSDESEAVKLFTNAFFATKIGFFNEIRCLSDKLGLDWETVLAGMLSDGRIAHSHTQVPGHDGKRGFGGKCLPKDLDQLCIVFNNQNVISYILEAVKDRNSFIDREETMPLRDRRTEGE